MAMNKSIQRKITLSFSALLGLIFITSILFYVLMHQAQEKLVLVEVVEDFMNLTLELRRYEKNYFLYRVETDYRDNVSYLEQLDRTVEDHAEVFASLQTTLGAAEIDQAIRQYREQMDMLHELNTKQNRGGSKQRLELQSNIREMGQELTEYADEVTAREKMLIHRILDTSKTVLLYSTIALVTLSIALVALMREKLVTSLRLLETYSKKVAHGEMVDPPAQKVEEEIQAIFTAFTRMNNELQLRQRQMVQSEKLASLGTLLAGVAHELNNPLSNISSSAQILAEEIGKPDQDFHQTLVGQIDEQADKARDIVRTLLEFSRTKEFTKEEINLVALVNSALRLLRAEIPSGMEIILDMPDDLDVQVDKQRMQQVFLNLLKNAIDACQGSGKVWIAASAYRSGSKQEVEILVSDNGPGIPQESLQKIFDPFYSSKDVGKGSGLGLFIVHDIIESHGGTISVDSRIDEGTTFIIWLPGREEDNE